MTPELIDPPAIEPVSLADARAWLRADGSAEDDLIGSLVVGARLVVEAATRRSLITQTWRLTFERGRRGEVPALGAAHCREIVDIPLAPFRSVVELRVRNAAGLASVIPASAYVVEPNPERARVVFVNAPPAGEPDRARVEMDVVAGYGDQPGDVPEPLRLAIRMLAARWYENRGDVDIDASGQSLTGAIGALVAPYRRARLA